MKGRMFVVNEDSLNNVNINKEVAVICPELNGKQWVKTVSDIMADMLQIEIGDYIFLWETKTSSAKSRIYGVYRAISKPFYRCDDENDNAPFKIKVEVAYDFKNPVDEYTFLNCPYIKNNLWTVIGKKVAGKSRGTSPLSIEETSYLITMLIGINPDYTYYPFKKENIISIDTPLKIDYTLTNENADTSLFKLNPNTLSFFKSDHSLRYEKMLETIFNYEMTNKNLNFFAQLDIDVNNIIWYSNYLPYSIEQSEMDYVIMESNDKNVISKIYVIEFMINKIDIDHINRCLLYSKWVSDTLALGQKIVQPILICQKSVDFIIEPSSKRDIEEHNRLSVYIKNCEMKYDVNPLRIYTYKFDENLPKFIRKK